MDVASLLGGGAGGGGTTINPDMSMHANSESNGTFGDHSIGLGGGKYSTLILAGAAVLIAALFFRGRK